MGSNDEDERDSNDLIHDKGSLRMKNRQTGDAWTIVDHEKGRVRRRRILVRKIQTTLGKKRV